MKLENKLQFSYASLPSRANVAQTTAIGIHVVLLSSTTPKRETMIWSETTLQSSSSKTLLSSLILFTAKNAIQQITLRILIWHLIFGVFHPKLYIKLPFSSVTVELRTAIVIWMDTHLILSDGLMTKVTFTTWSIIIRLAKESKTLLQLRHVHKV